MGLVIAAMQCDANRCDAMRGQRGDASASASEFSFDYCRAGPSTLQV